MADRSQRLGAALRAALAAARTAWRRVTGPDGAGRGRATALAIGAVLVSALIAFATTRSSRDGGAPAAAGTVAVSKRPHKPQLTVNGLIGASRLTLVPAPFDGTLRQRAVEIGAQVEAGAMLAVMDEGDLENRIREAKVAALRTGMMLEALTQWQTSPEVMRARRAVETAEIAAAKAERQASETKTLYDRGIVSRNEYEGLTQQRDSLKVAAIGAKQDLEATIRRGDADNRKVIELEHANALSRLAELERQKEGIIIRAPAAGVITRPPATALSPNAAQGGDASGRLSRGQPLMAIAETATLHVVGRVDEVDINLLRVGQKAAIMSDAFAGASLDGKIISISAEADPSAASGSRMPFFEVKAAFAPDTPRTRSAIRLGMSARMVIDVGERREAIIVPVEAVRSAAEGPIVRVRAPATGQTIIRRVMVGRTTPEGIEIVSGLEPGDVVETAAEAPGATHGAAQK